MMQVGTVSEVQLGKEQDR